MFNYVRPSLLALFVVVCMLWYVAADASPNNTSIFVPPDVHRPTQPVPEPAALSILATGVAAALVARRRRRK